MPGRRRFGRLPEPSGNAPSSRPSPRTRGEGERWRRGDDFVLSFPASRGRIKCGDVQANPDCQSRRDRLPDHQIRAPHGHRNRRGLFRGRPRCVACGNGRHRHPHRPAARRAKLPGHRQDRGRLQAKRRRGGASRLWLSLRTRRLCAGAGQGGDRLHRAEREGDRRHGRQDRVRRRPPPAPTSRRFPAISA